MSSVTADGPGMVAVGWRVYELAQSVSRSAVVWTSADGTTWSPVPYDEGIFGGAPIWVGSMEMNSLTVGGPGLVAVGSRDGETPIVWTSPDGINWSQVHHDETAFGGKGETVMMSVTATGSALVAVGSASRRLPTVHAAVWISVPEE